MFAGTDSTPINDFGPLESVAMMTYLKDLYFNTTVPVCTNRSILGIDAVFDNVYAIFY